MHLRKQYQKLNNSTKGTLKNIQQLIKIILSVHNSFAKVTRKIIGRIQLFQQDVGSLQIMPILTSA